MFVRSTASFLLSRTTVLAFILWGGTAAFGQSQPIRRPLALHQTHYRLRAGDHVELLVAPETADFIRTAKTRRLTAMGAIVKGLVVGQGMSSSEVLLGASLNTEPGEYDVTLSAVGEIGEERTASVHITVESLAPVPSNASGPPVILLNGWQFSVFPPSSCPMTADSTKTFGSLQHTLEGLRLPVYFFENCTECPNCLIETLGAHLGQLLNSLRDEAGKPVPQVDLVAHSMGGLIARAYLAGLQANSYAPPVNPKVRKLIEIATPNFGSFLAAQYSWAIASGTQSAEMIPGSPFLWELATWNQGFVDDLRGVDALAIVGNGGTWSDGSKNWKNASDGVVSVTSASLSFARDDSRTRILNNYCHIDSNGSLISCDGPGIASASETLAAVQSFLAGTSSWMGIGYPPSAIVPTFGGIYVGAQSASGPYVNDLTQVKFGSASLSQNSAIFYGDFLPAGQSSVQFVSPTLGSLQATRLAFPGTYSALRMKVGPFISSVTPVLSGAALQVASGGTISIRGSGFGQQCSGCQVLAYPGPIKLPVSSWTDSAIGAFLPATFNGFTTVLVQAASGADVVNVMAAAPALISLSATQLSFSYTVGGALPAVQTVAVSNAGGGTLSSLTATTNVSWLTLSSATGSLTISANPTGLAPGPHTGTVSVSAPGATNSPQSISVSLMVNAAPNPPAISLSKVQLGFSYTVGAALPVSQSVTVANSGGGSLNWAASANASWISVTSTSNTLTVSANPANLTPGAYSGSIAVTAIGAANSPQTISVALTVTAAQVPPSIFLSKSQLQFSFTAGDAPPPSQSITVTNSGGGSLNWAASANASWIGVTSTSNTLTVSVNPAILTPGPYSGSIAVAAAGASNTPQTISVTLTVSAASVVVTSVKNSASNAPGPIAPCEMVSIFGTGLGPATGTSFSMNPSTGMVDTALAGVRVLFGSAPAPITYASDTQVNAVVPCELAGQSQAVTVMQVEYQGVRSAGTSVILAAAAPGVFTFNSTGTGQAIAANQDGSFNGPSSPAAKGSYVTIYFTGGGQTNPPGVTGSVNGSTLQWLTQDVSVTVGGVPAEVQFDGAAPGLIGGVYQLNVRLASDTPSGSEQPLIVSVGGAKSPPTATLSVQ